MNATQTRSKGRGSIWPGILTAFLIAVLAYIAAAHLPGIGAVLLALLVGVAAGNSFLNKPLYEPGIKFTEKYVLETSIVLIGFGFNLKLLQDIGWPVFIWLVFSVIIVVALARLVGKWVGTPRNFNYLLGVGSAICGSAAIAAAAPLLRAKEEETGLALTLINLLGLIGIILLPILSLTLGYTELEAGLLTGGTLQSMGHVVAAAFSLNPTTGEVATVVKMGRISLLVPLLLFLYFANRKKTTGTAARLKFPFFIGLFILTVALGQMPFFPNAWAHNLALLGDMLLIMAMAGIGLRIKIKPLMKISAKGSLLGLVVFLFQVLLFAVLIGYAF